MLRSDICSRTATGGIRAIVAGSRVTSAFMSLSSSSSCFRTAQEKKKSGELWQSRPRSFLSQGTPPSLLSDQGTNVLECWSIVFCH